VPINGNPDQDRRCSAAGCLLFQAIFSFFLVASGIVTHFLQTKTRLQKSVQVLKNKEQKCRLEEGLPPSPTEREKQRKQGNQIYQFVKGTIFLFLFKENNRLEMISNHI
jgi:hypothetical protein